MITVLGASGFVGSSLVNRLKQLGVEYAAPARDAVLRGRPLGEVIYCIGLTADFRTRPFDTIEAHVCKLNNILKECDFTSLTYLSSARIYVHNTGTVDETIPVPIHITDPFDLYNSSKLTGELIALNCGRENIKVARLSNVYGMDFNSENFITSIIKDAIRDGKIVLRTTPDSAKDYISLDDVVSLLLKISGEGQSGIYNVASGVNTPNSLILDTIKEETGCEIEYSSKAEKIIFPPIRIDKIKSAFGFSPSRELKDDLRLIIREFREWSLQKNK
jgi:nucleoside-diphosphate-sugar epimerase